ncbi:MAG: 50S ribosomal protein L17 [Planctomycetota bacterium]
MRHRVSGRKLGRRTGPRKALLRGLARSLIISEEGRIETTVAKAKEVRPFVERLVTLCREDSDLRRRRAVQLLHDVPAVTRLFSEIAPRYAKRPGGYTRIVRTGKRLGDKGEKAMIEFVLDAPAPQGDSGSKDTSSVAEAPEAQDKPKKKRKAAESGSKA